MRTLKILLINLGLATLLIGLLIWGTLIALDRYTHKGEYITVRDFKGMQIEQLEKLTRDMHLRYKIMDSIYVKDLPPMTVIDQKPAAGTKVKENRTIYVIVNARSPKKIRLPDFTNKSLKQAKIEIENAGLKVGELIYIPHNAANYVFEQQIDGKKAPPGTLVQVGTKIDLVLGDGLGNTKVNVPRLVGLTYEEARAVAFNYGLNIGAIVYGEGIEDTANAYVVKQNPDYKKDLKLKLGETIDIILEKDLPIELKDTLGYLYIDTLEKIDSSHIP